MNEAQELQELAARFPAARRQFETDVEQAALAVIAIAAQISSAIGEVAIVEAKNVIVRQFTARLMTPAQAPDVVDPQAADPGMPSTREKGPRTDDVASGGPIAGGDEDA